MTRRCSHCSNNGHNSRTCPMRGGGGGSGGVKLFGVRLTDGSIIKKSASMGNLSAHFHSSSCTAAASPKPGSPSSDQLEGYLSDDPIHASSSSSNRRSDRKKGIPWTEEEHRLFLLGLQKLGKGDWRGISKNFVTSRTPTQVASHAQKYFIRQCNATRKKRRSSLFDMVPDMATDQPPPLPEEPFLLSASAAESDMVQLELSSQAIEGDDANALPSLNLSLRPDYEPMETGPGEPAEENKEITQPYHDVGPEFSSFFPAYVSLPFPLWPSSIAPRDEGTAETTYHQILKPVPVHTKEHVNTDELVGMSKLSLGESGMGQIEPSLFSQKLTSDPSRRSAFHPSMPINGSDVTYGG